jgi:hypothetical protein
MFVLIAAVVVVIVFNVAFGVLEWFLAKSKNKVFGLVLPFFFFITAVMSMLTSIEKTFTQLLTVDTPIAALIVMIALFVFINIPTIVTYAVYFRTRKKLGERPWPLRPKTDDPS